MRLRAILFAMIMLGGAVAGALGIAQGAARHVERGAGAQLAEALAAAGQHWIRVETDGLIVALSGEAPDEASRFRALDVVRQVVDVRRISDRISVRAADPRAPPPFALELLRNESEVSLIGLVPEAGARSEITAALAAAGLGRAVTDMLETAAHPAPEGWAESLDFALQVLADLPRAKISIAPAQVTVMAVAATDAERSALESRLEATRPTPVALSLDISSPRPVIAPFALDFSYAGGVGRFDACSAETVEDVAQIDEAARLTGFTGSPDCAVGLGAPSPDWVAAVEQGLAALREMGGGRFALTDIAAVLTGPEGIETEQLTAIGARLDTALPSVFSLTTVMPPQMETLPDGEQSYAPRFDATLSADGALRLDGPLLDQTSRDAITSYAAALFGHDRVINATVIDPLLPEGWPGRVLAGVEALSQLEAGRLQVTPEQVALDGWGLAADVNARVEDLLAAKVTGGALVDVRFNQAAAAALEVASRPAPQICAEEIAAIMERESIRFAAGSATIETESRGVISAIADVLRACPGAQFEIGGHTDAQGGAEANQRLSDARAAAVVAALRAEDLPMVALIARGHGADQPVADNATAEGRARNRRIAFSLLDAAAETAPGTAPETAAGTAAGTAPGTAAGTAAAETGGTEGGAAEAVDEPQ